MLPATSSHGDLVYWNSSCERGLWKNGETRPLKEGFRALSDSVLETLRAAWATRTKDARGQPGLPGLRRLTVWLSSGTETVRLTMVHH